MKLYELFDSERTSFDEWFQGSIAYTSNLSPSSVLSTCKHTTLPERLLHKRHNPIIFYHGSDKIFKTFTTDYGVRYNGNCAEVPLYFSRDKSFAEDFGNHVYQCFLKITKLFDGECLVEKHSNGIDEEDMSDIGKKLWNDLNNNKIFKFTKQENIYPVFLQIVNNEYLIMEKNEMLKWLKQNGFDGFLVTGEGATNWAVMSGKQVWIDRRLT